MELINLARPYMELIYFVSGVMLVVAAIIALKQLSIAKKTLKIQSKRDALKLTATECSRYFEKIIPLQNELDRKIEENEIKFFKGWEVKLDGNKLELRKKTKGDIEDFEKMKKITSLTEVCNSLEGFATYFNSGVADEYVAFNTVGTTFVNYVDNIIPWVIHCRDEGYYKNLVSLYVTWKNRSEASLLRQKKEKLEERLSKIGDKKTFTIGVDET